MRLAQLGPRGQEIPAVWDGGGWRDARPVLPELSPPHLDPVSLAQLRTAVGTTELAPISNTDNLHLGPPVARPGAIIGVGLNYASHAAESGVEPPAAPVIFLKTPNTLAGPYDPVTLPPGSEHTDWEVELGVVIGTRASYLGHPSDASSHISGFVLANDLTERRYQVEESGGQWSKGKCCPGFTPLGPYLVTADEFDCSSVRLRSWVNGQLRQDSTTAEMIFDVPYLIWHLSQFLTFEPGDVLLTGTPAGVGLSGRFPYLRPGDVVETEIDGLGRQRQVVVSAERHPGQPAQDRTAWEGCVDPDDKPSATVAKQACAPIASPYPEIAT